jgi:hypothetical protein
VADLYAIAEQLQRKHPRRYRDVYFEERHNGSLWFDTYPAQLSVFPYKRSARLRPGVRADAYVVGFSWGDADVDIGEYKTARKAVETAMDAARWSEAAIKDLFGAEY